MTVSVLVPWRPGCRHRDAAWQWVSARWAKHFPTWQVVRGVHDVGPWCKAEAVADALHQADGDMLVIADADVWTDPRSVELAVANVRAGVRPWAVPHQDVRRLTEGATGAVLGGTSPSVLTKVERRPYLGIEGGGMVVLPRTLYNEVPLDTRFRGWGGEDEAWGIALHTIAGYRWRGLTPLYHLWHPPQDRLNKHIGSRPSNELRVRYTYASRAKARMAALLAEMPTLTEARS